MPFHVEVSSYSAHRHARVFNLGEAEMRQTVLEPWVEGRPFEFGEKEWDPRECSLRVLEGPTLEGPDLAFGQGWSNAQRSAEDVTRQMLEVAEQGTPVPGAAVIAADSLDTALAMLRAGEGPQPVRWSEAWGRVDGRDPSVAAVILVLRPSEPEATRS